MTVRDILLYPAAARALRRTSRPVPEVDQEVKNLIIDLKDTLLAHPEGIGLAAPQINVHQRVIVVRLGADPREEDEPDPPLALVNPKILEASNPQRDFDGCLSFPGLYGETVRPHRLRISARDRAGRPQERILTGFDAVLVHHEIDHLNGVLFIDHAQRPADLYRMEISDHGEVSQQPLTPGQWAALLKGTGGTTPGAGKTLKGSED